MYFTTSQGVYLTYYNSEIVVLDVIKNRYLVLQKEIAHALHIALSHQFISTDDSFIPKQTTKLPEKFYATITTLQAMRILDPQLSYKPSRMMPTKKDFSSGMDNIDWRMEYGDLKKDVSKTLVFKAFLKRARIEWLVKGRSFHHLIQAIKQAGSRQDDYQDPQENDVSHLATVLNHACFYFPYKTKCLEWAATLALLALERRWKCNLVIGIQNTPFKAHAWVEACGRVIADTQALPKNLSTILVEPFSSAHMEKGIS